MRHSKICKEKTRKIIAVVNQFYGVNCLENTRKMHIVIPRQIAMYYAYNETNLGYSSVGLLFNKDHSTIVYAVRMVKNMMDFDAQFKKDRKELEDEIFKVNFKTPKEFQAFQLKEELNKIVSRMNLDKLTELKASLC